MVNEDKVCSKDENDEIKNLSTFSISKKSTKADFHKLNTRIIFNL